MDAEMNAEPGTADRIVDVVEDLMMSRGFNAISYADIATVIGIRKASIHYHFPTKADLGEAVIKRYADKMAAVMTPPETLSAEEVEPALEALFSFVQSIAESRARVCLGCVLGAEYQTLADGMQREVRRFYTEAQQWLGAALDRGRSLGVLRDTGEDVDEVARMIFSAVEGALIIGRALDDPSQLAATFRQSRRLAGM